jgi:MraZ protein
MPKTPELVPVTPAPYKEPVKEPIKRVTGTVESATNGGENLQPLPMIRPRPTPKPKAVLPLTGTAVTTLTGRTLTLPANVREQLGDCDTVLVSPGSSRCLWITNQAHLDRLAEKLEKSPAREDDIQAFKRLYYAQIVKLPVRDARLTLTDRLAEFAGLAPNTEVVLVGIDDHFELWDAATWRKFAATRKAEPND